LYVGLEQWCMDSDEKDQIECEQRVRDVLPDDAPVDELKDDIETALRHCADRYDVDVKDDAVRLVQEQFVLMIVESVDRPDHPGEDSMIRHEDTPTAWFEQLRNEMRDPESRRATNSIGLVVAMVSSESECLRSLTNEALSAKYNR